MSAIPTVEPVEKFHKEFIKETQRSLSCFPKVDGYRRGKQERTIGLEVGQAMGKLTTANDISARSGEGVRARDHGY